MNQDGYPTTYPSSDQATTNLQPNTGTPGTDTDVPPVNKHNHGAMIGFFIVLALAAIIFVVFFIVLTQTDDDSSSSSSSSSGNKPITNGCSLYQTPADSGFSTSDYYNNGSTNFTAQARSDGSGGDTCDIPDDLTDTAAFEAEFRSDNTPTSNLGRVGWVVTNNTDATYDMYSQFYDDSGSYSHTKFVTGGKANSVVGWTDNLISKQVPVFYNNQSFFFSITMPGTVTPTNIGMTNKGGCLLVPSFDSAITLVNLTISLDPDSQLPVITPAACTTSAPA